MTYVNPDKAIIANWQELKDIALPDSIAAKIKRESRKAGLHGSALHLPLEGIVGLLAINAVHEATKLGNPELAKEAKTHLLIDAGIALASLGMAYYVDADDKSEALTYLYKRETANSDKRITSPYELDQDTKEEVTKHTGSEALNSFALIAIGTAITKGMIAEHPDSQVAQLVQSIDTIIPKVANLSTLPLIAGAAGALITGFTRQSYHEQNAINEINDAREELSFAQKLDEERDQAQTTSKSRS